MNSRAKQKSTIINDSMKEIKREERKSVDLEVRKNLEGTFDKLQTKILMQT